MLDARPSVAFATSTLAAARAHGTYFGARKVFLSTIPGLDLGSAACREQLDACRRAQLLVFARADFVAAMDPALVAASEWDLGGAQMHFLVVS